MKNLSACGLHLNGNMKNINNKYVMDSFLKISTLDNKWFLCEDLRWHIWKMSKIRTCRICHKKLDIDSKISICFIKDGCLCFYCWHKIRAHV